MNEIKRKGRLKIFFGYAAGVGKTYAMLQAAHDAKKSGIDVVAGYIEPHVRDETKALVEGLEIIPTLKIDYKGKVFNEFNLDEVIKRNPDLVLIDELAHSNAVGCRHRKRYQDIEEILRCGIDVYTTVNVQHIESLNDIVESITHIRVRERIPDDFFDSATQVKLVDIEPEELIERLKQGKVYKGKQTKRALEGFFTKENLASLREIALRRTADRVNKILEKEKNLLKDKSFYTDEHILLCLSASPSNGKVIRTAARMAHAFHGELTAIYVETPNHSEMNSNQKKQLRVNMKIAEQLGAKIVTVYGEDISYQIAEYAKASSVSKIIMGKTNGKFHFIRTKPSFVEKLISYAPNIDVHIIPDKGKGEKKEKKKVKRPRFNIVDVFKSFFLLFISTIIGLLFYDLGLKETNIITVYILGILLISITTSYMIYGIISSFIGVLAFNYFFADPRLSFHAYDIGYPITFLFVLIVSLITSTLTTKVKNEAKLSARKSYRTELLLETNKKMQEANDIDEIIGKITYQISKLLDKTVIIYPFKDDALKEPVIYEVDERLKDEYITEEEKAVVEWVLKNNKIAGATTDTLKGSKAMYIPLSNYTGCFGVLGILMESDYTIEPSEKNLLFAMLNEAVFAMERYYLNENKKEVEMEAEKERLRSNLLRAISHDLRTPLTCISGNASILLESSESLDNDSKKTLYEDIYNDSLWLINLVENLLSITRIDNGGVKLNTEVEFIEEIIIEAVKHINTRKTKHNISINIKDDMLMTRIDARLIIQVIINIVENAIKYTDEGTDIEVLAKRENNKVIVEISDTGCGIPDENKEKLFDMFFTTNKGDSRRGLGLGLSLCKSIIEAHGETIYVRDNKPHGTIFGFSLPLEEVNIYEN